MLWLCARRATKCQPCPSTSLALPARVHAHDVGLAVYCGVALPPAQGTVDTAAEGSTAMHTRTGMDTTREGGGRRVIQRCHGEGSLRTREAGTTTSTGS